EREALKDLQKDANIVIKPADKGGGVIIWKKEKYMEEIYRQLEDSSTYQELQDNPLNKNVELYQTFLNKGLEKGILNQKEFEFLNVKFPKIPVFYVLPKVHKNADNPPGRPIVSGIGSLLAPLSKYIDQFLQDPVKKYIKAIKETWK
ncbi:Hypothetical predicted protein, partial [Pelobates cultripes]